MPQQSVASRMYQVMAFKQDLEARASRILEDGRAFQELSIRPPRLSPPELGFYQATTWLYGFYYEAGRVSFPFLINQFDLYGLDQGRRHQQHYEGVRFLRTYLQHNLNLESAHDAETQRLSEEWFSGCCGSFIPGSDEEWSHCLNAVLLAAESFLQATIDCVRQIERDESRKIVIEQWSARVNGYHPVPEFERLVSIAIHDMGQNSLDPRQITQRFYGKWSSSLKSRARGYNFEEEARKLIEQTLLNEAELPLPVSGQDIMRELGFPPGPEVGKTLRLAKALYAQSPCSKAELIAQLKAHQDYPGA